MKKIIITIAAVLTLIGCNEVKEVENIEPIAIDVKLYKGKYINAETNLYKAGDSLIMSLERSSYGYGAKYIIYISREIEYVKSTLRQSQVWIDFTDGSRDYFEKDVFISDKGFDALMLDIEPAIYEGKKIKEIRVQEMYKGEDRNWVLKINAQEPIGKVLNDMLDACNKFKETREKYK